MYMHMNNELIKLNIYACISIIDWNTLLVLNNLKLFMVVKIKGLQLQF
jgi:hypothetical protein